MDNKTYYDNTVSSKGQVSEWVTFGGDEDKGMRAITDRLIKAILE